MQKFILNLRKLCKYLEYKNFKIQMLQTILTLIHPNCYMAATDLKDDSYSVKNDCDDTHFLNLFCNSKFF